MSEISLVPSSGFGYGFVPPEFLPEGKNEYWCRDMQANAPDHSWRPLNPEEIEILVRNGNTCTNWGNFLVEDPFDPNLIKNSLFAGLVRVGALENQFLRFHDFMVPAGITNSRVISCDIGDNCAIHDCSHLSYYIVGDRVILSRIDEMASTNHAKFGEGVVKEGEDEAVRVWIDPLNEAGGRSVLPFSDMICADAYLWTVYRDDAPLMDALKAITQAGADPKRGWYATVGHDSVIKSCRIVKDVRFGPASYVKGANKLKNLTVKSSHAEPTQIGEGVELVNGIIGYGCHVFYGVKAVRFVLGNNASLKYGARLIHSILGDNSTISCCEVLNNLVFPGHEQHHNNSFLIASMVMGQSNMAAGATVGSNHNSRGNDGEIIAGRGFWPGLSTTLKHNCRFASYTLISKGNYPAELNIPLPFSLVIDNHRQDRLEVMPAYWWLYNMYALERNSWKYRTRDRRKTVVQRIEADHLAPDTAKEMLEALTLLERWTGKAWFVAEDGGDDLPEASVLEAKGRALLSGDPALAGTLFVTGEMMERSSRPVRILKVVQAWNAYREMLLFYGVRSVAAYLSKFGIHYGYFAAQAPKEISLDWVNMGGQLVPAAKVEGLRAGIRNGLYGTWAEIHAQYEAWWTLYPKERAENAYAVLRLLTGKADIDAAAWNDLCDEGVKLRRHVEEQVYVSKAKDYTNAFRGITYRNEAERDAVLGKVEDNSFIRTARRETAEFIAMIDSVRE